VITRKSIPIGLILLLCILLMQTSSSAAQTVAQSFTENPNFSCYRSADSMVERMQILAPNDSALSKFSKIGDSVEGKPIYALEIGNEDNADKPHFILLAGLHGNDFSQPEVGLQLAEKLLQGYETDADLHWIVDNVEIDLILLTNPDGRQVAELEAVPFVDPRDVVSINNSNSIDLEENFCFRINDSSNGCFDFPFELETLAITDYINKKLMEPTLGQPPQKDSNNLFIYFSSHNKETPAPDPLSNYQGRLRIPKFYTFNPTEFTDPILLRLKELTEMLRVFGSDPKYYIDIFKTEGVPHQKYPVDFTYFSYGTASVELSAPPTYDSHPLDCSMFTSEHIKNYTSLLLNAAKSATQPYKIGYGPIVAELVKTEGTATGVNYRALILAKNQIPDMPESNPITSIWYYIDQPTGTISGELQGWQEIDTNPYTSKIEFSIPTEGLTPGKHILTLQACSQDEADNPNGECGLPLSAFLNVPDPENPVDPDPTEPVDPDPTEPVDPDPTDTGRKIIYLPLIGR
jgi:carboxypeptidase T